jgi:hypothetical protein
MIIIIIISCVYRFLFVYNDTYMAQHTVNDLICPFVEGHFGPFCFKVFEENVLNPRTNRDVIVSKINELKKIPGKRSD